MEQMMQSRIDKSNEQILDVPEFFKPQNTKNLNNLHRIQM